MGESFLGLPNRFKIIDGLWDGSRNPNHALSAYQGYVLAKDYLKRSGGLDFAMTGSLYTQSILPTPNINVPKDIGTETYTYRNVYATNFHGNASTATRLQTARTISLTGSVTGSVTTDLSGNVTINTTTNHNHDSLYVKKVGNTASDPITGPLYARSIVPTADVTYSLGTSSKRYVSIFTRDLTATNISGTLSGNASTASKLNTSRNISLTLTPSTDVTDNTGVFSFDGSNDVRASIPAPYLPINGGTLYGGLSIVGDVKPFTNGSYSLGDSSHKWKQIYGDTFYGTTFDGLAKKAEKLNTSRTIKVVLNNSDLKESNYGSSSFDGSSDVTIDVWAPYLPINGGTIRGTIQPSLNNEYSLGSTYFKFKDIYATNLYGNADTTTKLQTARTLTIGNTGKTFDGSGDVSWSLAEIGAANANVGTTIIGRYYAGLYIVGTKTGYLEAAIRIPPGTWLLDAAIHHCCGGFRIGVTVEDTLSGAVLTELSTINPGECHNHYWSMYRSSSIYVNSGSSDVNACIFLNTVNISDDISGTVYENGWEPKFRLSAVRLK